MSDTIRSSVNEAMKAAMRARAKERLGAIRLIQSEFKRVEVDERIEIDDKRAISIMDTMVKQRRDSAQQFSNAGRDELASRENAEIAVIQEFLPPQLSEDEIVGLIDQAIAHTGATGMQDMGRLMGLLKPQLQGRADMGMASGLVKSRLT